jgi:hypothetical protein
MDVRASILTWFKMVRFWETAVTIAATATLDSLCDKEKPQLASDEQLAVDDRHDVPNSATNHHSCC